VREDRNGDSQLSPEEAKVFLDDLGIQEPALNKLIRVSYDLLGLISFLTSGEDRGQAWTIEKGMNAQQARAGSIRISSAVLYVRRSFPMMILSPRQHACSAGKRAFQARGKDL